MRDDGLSYFVIVVISIAGYLIGGLVMNLLLIPYLPVKTINEVGIFSFIPLGIYIGVVFLVYFLSKFKVVRRD